MTVSRALSRYKADAQLDDFFSEREPFAALTIKQVSE
jgi:hypothetical protein